MKYVRVPRLLLKTLIERAIDHPDLKDVAQVVNRHCVFDEGCVALETMEKVAYRNVTDE